MPLQTTRIDLGEPTSRPSYTIGQQKSPQEPQDAQMAMGGDSQEMCLVESQTDDGGGQSYDVPKLTYANAVLDVTSSWAQSWRRHDIEGGEVFYQPEVSFTVGLIKSRAYWIYCSTL